MWLPNCASSFSSPPRDNTDPANCKVYFAFESSHMFLLIKWDSTVVTKFFSPFLACHHRLHNLLLLSFIKEALVGPTSCLLVELGCQAALQLCEPEANSSTHQRCPGCHKPQQGTHPLNSFVNNGVYSGDVSLRLHLGQTWFIFKRVIVLWQNFLWFPGKEIKSISCVPEGGWISIDQSN